MAHTDRLSDRAVIQVTGPEAHGFLQGLITQDMTALGTQPALFAGLLTPQGKILFDFFVVRDPQQPESFFLDCPQEKATELGQRLTLYRLRAKVEISAPLADWQVVACSDEATAAPPVILFPDPRWPSLGQRALLPPDATPPTGVLSEAAYHARRIAACVPEGGKDYSWGDSFPHDVGYDLLHGVSFTKGCYVGQEVVSRMRHRGSIRKRIVCVTAETPLPPSGTEIRTEHGVVGQLGSTDGQKGLALVRLDRVAKALAEGGSLTADGKPLSLSPPPWADYDLSASASDDESAPQTKS